MKRGTIIEVAGLLHRVQFVHADRDTVVTYCGTRRRFILEAQTSLVSCVACIATSQALLALAAAGPRISEYADTALNARRRKL